MNIKRIKVGYLETNCYIIEKENNVLIVDPGDNYELIKKEIKTKNIEGILITHYHDDHIGALSKLLNDYQVKVYDFKTLRNQNSETFEFDVLLNRGHTKDSVTFVMDNNMFTGDFIFKNTIGRVDLMGGSEEEMLESIKNIKKYKTDFNIYPGHGESTTYFNELKNNPYLNLEDNY